jgi:ATP-dependent helicase/nuclease subunit B
LGMLDNQRRYAREAYALSVLAGTRSQLDLIVGRRNADDDPLTPSRLLFACDDPTLADRVRRLFRPTSPRRSRPPLAGKIAATRERSTFVVPQPQPLTQPITALAVTSFRSYLACPYRFYLSRVLGLQGMDDVAEELDGAMFGTALHETLRRWGESDRRDSTDASEITEFLDQSLDEIVVEMFGKMVLPAVRLQLEQLRNRLQAFAHRQAEWAHAGWRIEQIEVPRQQHESATFIVDGQPLILRGRIDRIDVHHQTGERAILDYKSSDAGERPERVHQKSDEWIDLQLPLYRHLLPSIGIAGPVRLGFIVLPKDTSQTAFLLADWTDADLRAADEVAAEVVRNIRAEKFWPPADPPSAYADEFAAICQDAVFERQFAPC